MRISIIQPSRNNLKYLKWAYQAIRNNQGDHIVEICVADDASTDGT
ncbi:MAG: glycosyltransferase family A protein, partial [Minisyncoccia bacterium]